MGSKCGDFLMDSEGSDIPLVLPTTILAAAFDQRGPDNEEAAVVEIREDKRAYQGVAGCLVDKLPGRGGTPEKKECLPRGLGNILVHGDMFIEE